MEPGGPRRQPCRCTADEQEILWPARDTRGNTVVADAGNCLAQIYSHTLTLAHRHTRIWKMQAKLSIGVTVFIARCCLWSEDKSGSEIDLFVLITRALTHPPSGGILDSRIKGTGTHFYNPICRHVRGNVSPSGVALFASMLHLESIFFCNSPSVTSWKKKQNKNRDVLVLGGRICGCCWQVM